MKNLDHVVEASSTRSSRRWRRSPIHRKAIPFPTTLLLTPATLETLGAHYAPVRSGVLKPPRGDDGASRGPIGFVSLRTHADALLVLQCLQDASMNVAM